MRFLRTRTMPNEVAKHKNNANRVQTISTMAEDGDKHNNNAREFGKHKNNANDVAHHKNNGRRR